MLGLGRVWNLVQVLHCYTREERHLFLKKKGFNGVGFLITHYSILSFNLIIQFLKHRKLINLHYPIIEFYFHSSKFIKTIWVFRNSSNAAFVYSSFPTMDLGKLFRYLNNWKFVNIRYSSSNTSSFRMYSLHMVYIFDTYYFILR